MLHPTLNMIHATAAPQQKAPSGGAAPKPAEGLSNAQIEVLLKAVPVFSLTDAGGQPIVSKVPDATKGVTAIFVSPGTAAAALAQIKGKNAELATKLKINAVSLWDIYKLAISDSSPFLIQFVADPAELDAAKPLIKEGRTVRVPLFVAKNKKDNGLLTINQKGMEAIPMFLSKKDLDSVLRKFAKPELLTEIATDVVDLEQLLGSLTKIKDPSIAKATLVPPTESLDFLKTQPASKQNVNESQKIKPSPGLEGSSSPIAGGAKVNAAGTVKTPSKVPAKTPAKPAKPNKEQP
jgi:hypothetical protein